VGRTGRRPGNQDTREAILASARTAFAERGIDGASIRLIAAGAGVDPALVHHYFGTKDQLFLAAMRAPIDPAEVIPQILAGDLSGVGVRLVQGILRLWDSPVGGAAVGLVRSAVSNEQIAAMLREFVLNRILKRIIAELHLDPADGLLRATLVASQVAGLIMLRYVIRLEPIASTDIDTIAAIVGPTIQRYLTEPLPSATAKISTTGDM
jgi:AcrR family transcriptional regulator